MNARDYAKVDRYVALWVGKHGSGKSAAVASMAEKYAANGKRVKVMDIDKRFQGAWGSRDYLPDSIWDTIDIDNNFDVKSGWSAIDKELELLLIKQQQNQNPYGLLVLESVNTIHKLLLADAKRLKGLANKSTGRSLGSVDYPHPDDYNYASAAFRNLMMEGFHQLKMDIILSGWVVDEYGPNPNITGDEAAYAPNIVIGSKLLATSKIAEETPGYFDEVYEFSRETGPQGVIHKVEFYNKFAKTARPELRKVKSLDITGKSFYREYQKLITKA